MNLFRTQPATKLQRKFYLRKLAKFNDDFVLGIRNIPHDRRTFLKYLSLGSVAYVISRAGIKDVYGHAKVPSYPYGSGTGGPAIAISYSAQTQIVADGKWSENEWNYSRENIKGLRSEVLTNNDDDFAYFGLVTKNNTSVRSGLFGSIKLDTLHDAAPVPQKDDYTFSLVWKSDKEYDIRTLQGTGTGWQLVDNYPDLKAASGLTKTPFREQEVLLYEFAVPKSLIGNAKTMGIMYMALDSEQVWWPSRSPDDPSTWGDVIYKDEKIPDNEIIVPEFPLNALATLGFLSVLFSSYVLRRNRLTKR